MALPAASTGAFMLGGLNLVQYRLLTTARIDPVPGVWTRAGFTARAEWLIRRRQRLVLLLVDGDGFKAVNDTHGHDAGDAVITALAPGSRPSPPAVAWSAGSAMMSSRSCCTPPP